MTETITECPQCGFTDFDEMEICQACGFLSEDTSARNISFGQVVRDTSTRLRQMGFHGIDHDKYNEEDPEFCPSWSSYFGNIYHKDFE